MYVCTCMYVLCSKDLGKLNNYNSLAVRLQFICVWRIQQRLLLSPPDSIVELATLAGGFPIDRDNVCSVCVCVCVCV